MSVGYIGYDVEMDELKKMIREVPDFPKPGILFYDITTVLKDKDGFRRGSASEEEWLQRFLRETIKK